MTVVVDDELVDVTLKVVDGKIVTVRSDNEDIIVDTIVE